MAVVGISRIFTRSESFQHGGWDSNVVSGRWARSPPASRGRFNPGGAATAPLSGKVTRTVSTPGRPEPTDYCYCMQSHGRKVDLTRTLQTLMDGVSPDSSLPVLGPERPEPPRGSLLAEAVLAGVGRRQSTEFRWSSHLEGPLPGALERGTWLWTAAETLRRAYSAGTEE